jgi:folate-binding protein YgfZ
MIDPWQRFLATRGARFDEQGLACFPESTHGRNTAFADLAHLTLVRVEGSDAAAFLQSQLTSDVASLEPGSWQWSGYCNAKGRLLATLRLIRSGDAFLAELPRAAAVDLGERLRKFVLRSRVTFVAVTETHAGIGVGGIEAAAALSVWLGHSPPAARRAESLDGGILIGAGRDRWHCHLETGGAMALWERLSIRAVPMSTRAWVRFDLEDGIPWIAPETQALFVPQMVDFELLGGVSFSKGCYPGQEIVARSQYLGAVRRRLHVARSGTDLAPGTALTSGALPGQTVGNVVMSVPVGETAFQVLAVLDVESAAAGPIVPSGGGAPLEGVARVNAAA